MLQVTKANLPWQIMAQSFAGGFIVGFAVNLFSFSLRSPHCTLVGKAKTLT